jgi:hypothetical protein
VIDGFLDWIALLGVKQRAGIVGRKVLRGGGCDVSVLR